MTRQNNENGIVVRVKNCDMNKKTSDIIDGVRVPISSNETNQHYVFSVLEEQKKLIKTQSTLIGVCESLRTVRIRKNTPTPILRRLYRLAEDVLKRNS